MFIFNIISFFAFCYIPLKKKKVALIHGIWVTLVIIIVVNNFDFIRYDVSFDKKGNKITHDRFTGKKWKSLR